MAAVTSTMQALGSSAPDFLLSDTITDKSYQLSDYRGRPVLLMFICNHCPYVIHLIEPLVELANQAQEEGFFVAAISSNDIESYPQDSPQKMLEFAAHHQFQFPYLFDHSQTVAKEYCAACTPDFFIYDESHTLKYRGQMDSARPSNDVPVDGSDLRAALEAVKQGQPVSEPQTPSIGCNIKWKPGNEPDYF